MLRITIDDVHDTVTLRLEGRLADGGVNELRASLFAHERRGRTVAVDLEGIDYVDREGVALLRELRSREVRLLSVSMFVTQLLGDQPPGTARRV